MYKCEGGCLKKAHLANTHFRGVFKVFLRVFVNVSPPGVEPALSSWKVSVVTATPPSRTLKRFKLERRKYSCCLALKKFFVI